MIEFIGVIALPVSFLIFRWMPDRGITLSMPLGILIGAYLTWVLSYTGLVSANNYGPILSLIIIAVPSIFICWRNGKEILQHQIM